MLRIGILFIFAATLAAQEIKVVGPDPSVVRLGREATLTLSIDGPLASVALGRLPEIDELDVHVGAPVASMVQAIVDGRVVDRPRTTWSVTMKPLRLGAFTIPPFTVDLGGRSITTEPVALEAVRDREGDQYAFVEFVTPRQRYYVHEPVRLRVRIGFDASFFAANAIQLFRQPLDVPVHLQARWLRDLSGAVPLRSSTPGPGERRRFALNGAIVEGTEVEERDVDGRRFTVLEFERAFLPQASGELTIPEPLLRFAFATQFREDFVNGRVPVDRREAHVAGTRVVLDVQALPEVGRPAGFSGAVGAFRVSATASPASVRVGETVQVVLRIVGEGSFPALRPPSLEGAEGFHVLGMIQDQAPARRTVTYDLVALSDEVDAVPPIAFAFFDPRVPAGYRTVRTQAIPLDVRPLPAGARLPVLPGAGATHRPGETDVFGLHATGPADSRPPSAAMIAVGLLAPWLVAGLLWSWVRIRARDRADPARARARRAAARFRARTRGPDAHLPVELAAYVSARLACADPAVIAPGLDERLTDAGVAVELSLRTASTLKELVALDYGSGGPASDAADVRDLVEALESAFRVLETAP